MYKIKTYNYIFIDLHNPEKEQFEEKESKIQQFEEEKNITLTIEEETKVIQH